MLQNRSPDGGIPRLLDGAVRPGPIYDRVGAKLIVSAGALLMAVGVFLLSLGGGDVRTAIAALPSLGGEALQPGPAERLVLYRSHLGAGRARYEALAELALPGG